ncbi:hypothetical protein [Calothrix rhizosoleniae]|uniref:hypothetical protein n=2 Tax=Calothrix rhizosoleniae TaxID=888997 RepID=UPI0011786984|nr:hypothetical protein [Calothrix rhizosoleniae]
MQNAIAYSMNSWLQDNPGIFRLLHFLDWSVHHPIISLILLVFVIAILASIIKAIIRLIETASWSIIQIPLKLLLAVLQLIWLLITKVSRLIIYNVNQTAKTDSLPTLEPTDSSIIATDKQKRLAEISQRLTELKQEQEELLQEVTILVAAKPQKVNFYKDN